MKEVETKFFEYRNRTDDLLEKPTEAVHWLSRLIKNGNLLIARIRGVR